MAIHAGIPDIGQDVHVGQGIFCEAVLTLILVLTVIMTAVDRDDNILAPVAIGLAVTVDISAAYVFWIHIRMSPGNNNRDN